MLDRRTFIRRLAAAGALSALPGLVGCARLASARPSFLVFLADDLGYGDLASYGHPILRTPNLDAFAGQGTRFTDFHSAGTVCSPSRAALLTGRNPYRSGLYYIAEAGMHLQRDEVTIATLLRDAGYDTCFVGKWHLSRFDRDATAPTPGDHGFDWWFATAVNAFEGPEDPTTFWRNGEKVGPVDGWYCDVIVDEALTWLRNRPDPERPFFLEVCSHEPHTPVEPPEEYAARYDGALVDSLERGIAYGGVARPPHDVAPNKRYYYGTVEQLDAAFGRLIAGLDAQGLEDDTLVLFTSDNGPESPVNLEESRGEWEDPSRDRALGTPGPWRGMKRFPYEGGHRVPGLARWPGRVPAGAVSHELVNATDLLPTIAELAGIAVPADRTIDGTSVVPVLEGGTVRRDRPVFWLFPAHEDTHYLMPHMAMREGSLTLLGWLEPKDPDRRIMEWIKSARLERFALFDLATDSTQEYDLSQVRPDDLVRLRAGMEAFWAELQAEGPDWPGWTSK